MFDKIVEACCFAIISILGLVGILSSFSQIMKYSENRFIDEWIELEFEDKLRFIVGILLTLIFLIISIIKFIQIF